MHSMQLLWLSTTTFTCACWVLTVEPPEPTRSLQLHWSDCYCTGGCYSTEMTVIFPWQIFPATESYSGQKPVLPPPELVLTGWSHDEYASPIKQIIQNIIAAEFWVEWKLWGETELVMAGKSNGEIYTIDPFEDLPGQRDSLAFDHLAHPPACFVKNLFNLLLNQ